jgi:putative isomerase
MRAILGWNTWDVNHVNGVVHLESGARLRFFLLDPASGERKEQFNWQVDLSRLGPHSGRILGYARIDVQWKDSQVAFEFAAEGDRLACRVHSSDGQNIHLIAVLDGIWGSRGSSNAEPSGVRLRLADHTWVALSTGADPLAIKEDEFHFCLSQPIVLDVFKEGAPLAGSAIEILTGQWIDYEQSRLKTGGWLGESADGLTRSIHWNTIWEPLKERICSPVSREWCLNETWGGYVLFDWDTFFCAMMSALESHDLCVDNIRAILQEVTPSGFVPNFGSANMVSNDRSQPPVGAYCLLKAWRGMRIMDKAERLGVLKETFGLLLRWHYWWMPHRDGNGDGLLEWGSDPLDDPHAFENHTLRSAMFESGLDNSPMYDEAVFNPATNTMELADVGLNALYAMDAWALSEIAAEIRQDEEARKLHDEYVEMAERINHSLWNDEAGIYQNRRWDGQFSFHLSPTNFYPLIAGIVPPERALRMVQEHLLNEKEFWGEYVLPSISRSDPGYRRNEMIRDGVSEAMSDYWRGRIWGPMNFLVIEGLRRYGFDQVVHEFARKNIVLFLQEWDSENHVHENYNDLTGEGDDVRSANALYHWGALLAYTGIQELADCEPWDGWRFGNLDSQAASVEGIQLEEGRLAVKSGADGLRVYLDQHVLLESSHPLIVRGYRTEPGRVQFRLNGDIEDVNLRIGLPGSNPDAPVKTRIGQIFELGQVQTLRTDSDGCVQIRLPVPCEVEVSW